MGLLTTPPAPHWPSVLARLTHAEVLVSLARDRGGIAAAERAAKEADRVKELLPDNPVALRVALEARVAALYAYAAARQACSNAGVRTRWMKGHERETRRRSERGRCGRGAFHEVIQASPLGWS